MTRRNTLATPVCSKRYCSVMICQIPSEYFNFPHYISWINGGNGIPTDCYLWKVVEIDGVTVDIENSSKGYFKAVAVKEGNSISFELRFDKKVKEGICFDFKIRLFRKRATGIEEIGSSELFIQLLSAKSKDCKKLVMYFAGQDWASYSPLPPALPSDDDDEEPSNNNSGIEILKPSLTEKFRRQKRER